MDNNFESDAIKQQEAWIRKSGFATVKGQSYILEDGTLNLFEGIRNEALSYFAENGIKWWRDDSGPTGNTKSSQIACLNHLFPIRNDEEAVLAIINKIKIMGRDNYFKGVEQVPVINESSKGFVAFEVIDKNNLLKERGHRRGAYCTSVDALIFAIDRNEKKWIILFEWKYAEKYDPENKATKKERTHRYNKLIQKSSSLIPRCEKGLDDKRYNDATEYSDCLYYQEPFYQLMRQTLWAELVAGRVRNKDVRIREGEKDPLSEAVDYLHIHIVPKGNRELLDTGFPGEGVTMEETWRKNLTGGGSERYKIMSPEELFKPIKNLSRYKDLIKYLRIRYW